MKLSTRYSKYLLAAAVGLASAGYAQAQLQLNSVTASFLNLQPPGTGTIVNGALVQTFSSPVISPSIVLTNTPVAGPIMFNLSNPAAFQTFDTLRIDKQASNLSSFNSIDLLFNFDFDGGNAVDLAITYTFSKVTEGVNTFTYTITPLVFSGAFAIGAQNYNYTFVGDGLTGTVATGQSTVGTANFNAVIGIRAVPEPSTYALFGAATLGGIVAVRRYRASHSAPVVSLATA